MAAEDPNAREIVKALRGIRELFHGRFTDEEVATLYDINGRSKTRTVIFILQTESGDVSRLLQEQIEGWTLVQNRRRRIHQDILERARIGMINTTARQFACGTCDKSWWRKVPERKPVSKCDLCKVKYDPVPRDKEWGWAEFHCTYCGHEFGGFCEMGTTSPCYQCNQPVLPTRILPPKKDRQRRTSQTHSCNGCRPTHHHHSGRGGYNQHHHHGPCAHPSTRSANNLPKVLTPSLRHDSTGSTVDTFLPQDDLDKNFHEVLDNITELGSIPEEPRDNSESDNNSGSERPYSSTATESNSVLCYDMTT